LGALWYHFVMFDVFKKSNSRASVTDELLIDIYANKKMRGLAILIDKPFKKKLRRLELDLNDHHLIFIFDGEKKDLGTPLKDELVEFFLEREQVKFNIMDMQSLTAKESFMIPLKIINDEEAPEDTPPAS
jgi:hypothetical protein